MPRGGPAPAEVSLNIYDLHGTSAINAVTKPIGLGGAFHIGLEVYWLEWSFGWTPQGTGVHVVRPGTSWLGSFRERVTLGRTRCSVQEVVAILAELRRIWLGHKYHPLKRNCGHFCQELARHLDVREMPSWVNSLAATGDRLAGWMNAASVPAASIVGSAETGLPAPSLLGSHRSLAGADAKLRALGQDESWRDLEDDPRLERDWRWATEHMLSRSREAVGDPCVIA